MSKKLLLTFIVLTLLLASCSQPDASPTSAGPDTPVQVSMFRLVPPGFVSVGYCDLKRIREDPDLKSVFEAVSGGCPLSQIPDDVDASMAVVRPPSVADSSGITFGIVTIHRGSFDKEATAEPEVATQDYQGVELSVIETEGGTKVAYAFVDEVTRVLGYEAGVKAVLDTAQDLTTRPLADLGASLPLVFFALINGNCHFEEQDCTAEVLGLAKGPQGTTSTIQFYQFENAEMAADTLPVIKIAQEEGGIIQVGTVKIVGDRITQEGRFVKVEGTLPIEDLPRMFE